MNINIHSTQDLMNAINNNYEGVYEIKENIVLTENIILPNNSTLRYSGGLIDFRSCMITGSNTYIDCGLNFFFKMTNLQLIGSFKNKLFFPEWFGANGNSAFTVSNYINDSSSVSKALHYSTIIDWPGIYHAGDEIAISKERFCINQLNLLNTSLKVRANNTTPNIENSYIKNTKIIFQNDKGNSKAGILFIRSARNSSIKRILIDNVEIRNCDKGIYANAHEGGGYKYHSLNSITITNCSIKQVNTAIWMECNNEFNDTNNYVENEFNDFIISNNIFSTSLCDVYIKSIDGIIISNNIFFWEYSNDLNKQKRKSIRIGSLIPNLSEEERKYIISDQIKIHGNQIFEPQEEGILIDAAQNFQITNNNIVTTLTRTKLRSGIDVTILGKPIHGIISNNMIRNATKHGIEIKNGLEIQVENYYSINSNVIYITGFGFVESNNIDLSTYNHFGIFKDNPHLNINSLGNQIKLLKRNSSGDTVYHNIQNNF